MFFSQQINKRRTNSKLKYNILNILA